MNINLNLPYMESMEDINTQLKSSLASYWILFLMDLRRMWKSYPFRNSYRSLISSRTRRPTLLMCNELHSRVLYRTYSVSSIDFLSGQLNVMRENQEKNNVKTYRYLRHARKCYFHHWQSKIILIHENYIILSHLLLY